MARLSIALSIALFAARPVLAAESGKIARPTSPGLTIYLYGASWCAPCVSELRDITGIAAAAAPDRVVIVWEDDGIRRFRLPRLANVEVAGDRARRTAATWMIGNAGLPFTAVVDANGRKCAQWRGLLTAEVTIRLREACSSGFPSVQAPLAPPR